MNTITAVSKQAITFVATNALALGISLVAVTAIELLFKCCLEQRIKNRVGCYLLKRTLSVLTVVGVTLICGASPFVPVCMVTLLIAQDILKAICRKKRAIKKETIPLKEEILEKKEKNEEINKINKEIESIHKDIKKTDESIKEQNEKIEKQEEIVKEKVEKFEKEFKENNQISENKIINEIKEPKIVAFQPFKDAYSEKELTEQFHELEERIVSTLKIKDQIKNYEQMLNDFREYGIEIMLQIPKKKRWSTSKLLHTNENGFVEKSRIFIADILIESGKREQSIEKEENERKERQKILEKTENPLSAISPIKQSNRHSSHILSLNNASFLYNNSLNDL